MATRTRRPAARSKRAALLALYKWATGNSRSGNPYTNAEVRAARRALGDSEGYDLPARRPTGKIPGALYDLSRWSTEGDRSGNPYGNPEVRAANRALGGDGYDLPRTARKPVRRASR